MLLLIANDIASNSIANGRAIAGAKTKARAMTELMIKIMKVKARAILQYCYYSIVQPCGK